MRRAAGIVVPVIGMLLLCFSGCGKNNNLFSFAHSAGSNSDSKALLSDAVAALQQKDYDKAMEYYKKLLASDPDNAEAIYGEAAAELADAGIDIATLVSNLIKNNSGSSSAPHLSAALAVAANRAPAPGNILPDSIINNLDKIRTAVDNILLDNRLPSIVQGRADGSLSPDNPDVNLNLAFCYILHAALLLNDHVTFDSNYKAVIVPGANLSGDAQKAADDIINAYDCMERVVVVLNLDKDGTIASIKGDVKDLFDSYKQAIHDEYGVTITGSIN